MAALIEGHGKRKLCCLLACLLACIRTTSKFIFPVPSLPLLEPVSIAFQHRLKTRIDPAPGPTYMVFNSVSSELNLEFFIVSAFKKQPLPQSCHISVREQTAFCVVEGEEGIWQEFFWVQMGTKVGDFTESRFHNGTTNIKYKGRNFWRITANLKDLRYECSLHAPFPELFAPVSDLLVPFQLLHFYFEQYYKFLKKDRSFLSHMGLSQACCERRERSGLGEAGS